MRRRTFIQSVTAFLAFLGLPIDTPPKVKPRPLHLQRFPELNWIDFAAPIQRIALSPTFKTAWFIAGRRSGKTMNRAGIVRGHLYAVVVTLIDGRLFQVFGTDGDRAAYDFDGRRFYFMAPDLQGTSADGIRVEPIEDDARARLFSAVNA